jgi:hypothetical protein
MTPSSGRRAFAEGGARDVRSIVKLIRTAVGQASLPHELAGLLERVTLTPCRVLELAQALVPYAFDQDFAADRIASRKTRSASSLSVIAQGAYPEELAPAVRDVPRPAPIKRARTKSYGRDLPTIIARRPVIAAPFPRRRAFRIVGIIAAALTVALLVLIGTEGARLIHPHHRVATQTIEFSPLPEQAPIAPPPVAVTETATATPAASPSATPIPVMKTTDLPRAKATKKKR